MKRNKNFQTSITNQVRTPASTTNFNTNSITVPAADAMDIDGMHKCGASTCYNCNKVGHIA